MTARADIASAALVAIVQAERKAEKLPGRLGAIVRTHLETARLFAREARDEELAPGASDETAPISMTEAQADTAGRRWRDEVRAWERDRR